MHKSTEKQDITHRHLRERDQEAGEQVPDGVEERGRHGGHLQVGAQHNCQEPIEGVVQQRQQREEQVPEELACMPLKEPPQQKNKMFLCRWMQVQNHCQVCVQFAKLVSCSILDAVTVRQGHSSKNDTHDINVVEGSVINLCTIDSA